MPRFFIEKDRIKDGSATIKGDELKHIRKVLRLGLGDSVILFDEEGWEYHATITKENSRDLKADIIKKCLPQRDSPIEIILAQGLPRLPKMDLVIQKSTELGVSQVLPFHSHRSLPRLSQEKSLMRAARWRKIALESSKQCGRTSIPYIGVPVSFSEIVAKHLKNSLKIILWEEEKELGLKKILDDHGEKKSFFIIVGPEGGFIDTEIQKASEAGFHGVHIGRRILRTETAGISILSIIQHRFGDLS